MSASAGMAAGPIRARIPKVFKCRSSLRPFRNRLKSGIERPRPWTRAASAFARISGSFAITRSAQSDARAEFLDRSDSVGSDGAWEEAEVRPGTAHAPSRNSPITNRN
jgi:hypothetical protein